MTEAARSSANQCGLSFRYTHVRRTGLTIDKHMLSGTILFRLALDQRYSYTAAIGRSRKKSQEDCREKRSQGPRHDAWRRRCRRDIHRHVRYRLIQLIPAEQGPYYGRRIIHRYDQSRRCDRSRVIRLVSSRHHNREECHRSSAFASDEAFLDTPIASIALREVEAISPWN
jgi:hypothetical protein